MTPCFSIQICFYPRFNGGFYITGPGKYMTQARMALGFVDIRLWWQPGHDAEFVGMMRDSPAVDPSEYFTIPAKQPEAHAGDNEGTA